MSSPTSDQPKRGFVPPPPGYVPPGADTPTPDAPEPAEQPAQQSAQQPAQQPVQQTATPATATAEAAPAKRDLPGVAWLAGVAALVAIAGAVLPWFAPTGKGVSIPKAYCLQAGRVGFLAPLVLVVVAIMVLGPRLGLVGRNQPQRALSRDGLLLVGAGVVAGIVLVIVWFLLPNSYTFGGGTTWDQLQSQGHDLSRGPQLGYVISIVAAGIAVISGFVIMLSAARREP